MWRILAATILSFGLSFATPLLYHGYLSDVMEGMYSNHFAYDVAAPNNEYYLIPTRYSAWYSFRDGVTYDYGKKLHPNDGLLHLQAIGTDEFVLKSGTSSYNLEESNTPYYYTLVQTDLGINPILYLLRYLLIYSLLIIAPVALCAAFNRYALKLPSKWGIAIISASAIFGTAIVGYVYLRVWWKLFNGWVLS